MITYFTDYMIINVRRIYDVYKRYKIVAVENRILN